MIKIVCVGKVKDRNLSALIDDYAEKISHYHKLEIVEVKDEPIRDNEQAVLDKEAEAVLSKIRDDEYVILLDLHGKSIDSAIDSAKDPLKSTLQWMKEQLLFE